MRIEEGKYYRTRDGRKAGPVRVAVNTDNGPWQADLDDESNWCFDADGTLTNFQAGLPEDLVALWTDTGPIRTETVTVRRLEPGVYGRLRVREEAGMADGKVQVGASFVARNGASIAVAYLSAPELRELARVALELAEYLDHVD